MPEGTMDRVGRLPRPFSMRQMAKFTGQGSAMAALLAQLAHQDVLFRYNEFDFVPSKAIDANYWIAGTTNAGGGTRVGTPATQLANGVVVGVTDTTSGNAETLYGPLLYAGQYNCFFETRLQIDVITTLMFEVGLTDTATLGQAQINSIDTPTFTSSTNAVLVAMDTAATLKTAAMVTIGSGASMVAHAVTLNNGSTFTPKAGTYFTVRVGLAGKIPYAVVLADSTTGTDVVGAWTATSGDTAASQVLDTALLRPWIAVRTRTTAAKTLTVDYTLVGQDRNARVA